MTVLRVVLGVGAVALGVASLALAHDLRAAETGVERGDARFAAHPGRARWPASAWLPGNAGERVLALGDDLALRRGEQAFAVAIAAPEGLDNGRRRAQLRSLAELALSDVIASGSPAQASRAGNLAGILAATAEASEGNAAEVFDAAIRADPGNTDAKHNLELLLRRARVIGSREGAGTTSAGDYGEALAGAGAGMPGSGY